MPPPPTPSENWPDFRGPAGDGHSQAVGLPIQWSETKNVRWKTPLPERGWSSPVLWGGQIWLTTATEKGHEQFVLCLDRETGRILHRQRLFHNPNPQRHDVEGNTYASPSPVIEAGRVYLHFGTYGTACLETRTFRTLWTRRDLPCDHGVGPGSSPLRFEDRLILTMDGRAEQYLVALETISGRTLWKQPRGTDFGDLDGERRKAFCTPLLLSRGARPEIVSVGAHAACGYDPRTGTETWRLPHPGYSNASRPVAGGGLLFLNTGFDTPEIWAVRLDRPQGPTGADILWRYSRGVPTMGSPVLVDGLLFFLADSEFFTCLEAATGRELFKERIGGRYYASPLYADGRLYLFAENGKALAVRPGRTFLPLAENRLEEGCMASPAAVGRALFVRTKTHLYRLETPSARAVSGSSPAAG